MMSSRFPVVLLIAAVLVPALSGTQLYEAVEPHMGTLFRIKLYASDEQSAKAAFKAAFERIAQLDTALSDYNPGSELNLAAKAAASHPAHISSDLAKVLSAAQKISSETGGVFDVTVGALTILWRSARHDRCIPTKEAIETARAKCDYRKLHVDEASQTVTTDIADLHLDLGGIAKGYAADEALQVLRNLGITSALVAASGDLAFSDAPPGQAGWKIGIDSLDRGDKPFTRVITLSNAAVSTSGGTEQFLEIDGKRYSHIISPATGMGLETDLSVTTISRRGITADPAATAISVLGPQRGLAFAEQHKGLAVFILETTSSGKRIYESTSFKENYD